MSRSLGMSSICSACPVQLINFMSWSFIIATYMNCDISSQALLFSLFKKREREREAIIWSGTQKIKWMHSANEPFQKPDQNINLLWLLQNQTVIVWFKNTPQRRMCWKRHLQLIVSLESDETIKRWGLQKGSWIIQNIPHGGYWDFSSFISLLFFQPLDPQNMPG